MTKAKPQQALAGIRVIDLSRVLAGPFCTQILGDLGAEIIKIEKPGAGDDTRYWGPPFLKDPQGQNTSESAYYLSANRNKKSLAVDITKPEGQAIIHELLAGADILIENFKTGGLAKYGLGFDQVQAKHPHIIYTSITGFGQNGPLATEPGYDYLAQGMAGLMAATGVPDGEPMKAGVALSDIMTGLYAAIGTLAALQARDKTGKGQHVDVALLDCTLSAMTNLAQYYLTAGHIAPRLGNAHSTIVPYQTFKASDGYLIIAIGNDTQFARFCEFIGKTEWHTNPRFAKNTNRVANRDILVPMIADIIASRSVEDWVSSLYEIDIPCGPVNTMDKTFAMDQITAREMKIAMPHPFSDTPIDLVGSPLKLSSTPVAYTLAPPPCGAHTDDILASLLNKTGPEIQALREKNIIG